MEQVPVSIYAEATPNPSVLKFVANKYLVKEQIHEFKNIEDAKYSPLATRLFHFPFVKEVFITGNYVSITKFDIVEWEEVMHEMRDFIREYLAAGSKVINEAEYEAMNSAKEEEEKANEPIVPEEGIERKIVDILEEYVKPAVAQDGGNIAFQNYDDGVVTVQLQGACNGCPSSTMTLKSGIENILKQMLPGQIREVVAQ